jgi:uncharacterized protein (DUF1330 family)
MRILLGIAIGLAVLFGVVWAIGDAEPVHEISVGDPAYFAAVRLASQDGSPSPAPALAPGVTARLVTAPDFTLIGTDAPYWHRYMVLTGGDGTMPLLMDEQIEDALVARVTLTKPFPPLLGVIRLIDMLGLSALPGGEVNTDGLSAAPRPDVLPNEQAVSTLLAKDAGYQPHMMNFLKYREKANYPATYEGDGDVSGAKAYGRYGTVAFRTVMRTGGAMMFHGTVDDVLHESTGWAPGSDWDEVAMMRYPTPSAILSMDRSDDYHASLVDRDAGLDRTIVVSSSPL